MRTIRVLLIAAMIGSLPASARAQASPTPTNEDGTRYNEIIRTDGTREKAKVRVLKGPPPWPVGRMKLVASGVGWARVAGERLTWTENGGRDWRIITPPSSPDFDEHLSDVFFLDARRGWVLFSLFSKDKSDEDEYENPKFDLASTTDGGATWTRWHVAPFPKPARYGNRDRMPTSGWSGTVSFQDPLHGRLNITIGGQSMHTFWSFVLETSNGGKTWRRVPNTPDLSDADLLRVTCGDWWMIGTSRFGDRELFVTHDAAKSWRQVSVETPKEVLPASSTSYFSLPIFKDRQRGFLEVGYSGEVGVKSAMVLFATNDGGRVWTPNRILRDGYGEPTVIDSNWIFVTLQDQRPTVESVDARGKIVTSGPVDPDVSRRGRASEISFISPAEGWVIVGDGQLLSTTDGGKTWTDIRPGPKSD